MPLLPISPHGESPEEIVGPVAMTRNSFGLAMFGISRAWVLFEILAPANVFFSTPLPCQEFVELVIYPRLRDVEGRLEFLEQSPFILGDFISIEFLERID